MEQKPISFSGAVREFGGAAMKILPPYSHIPSEFKSQNNPWAKWQANWFFSGLTRLPVPKPGINLDDAMANLACIQNSWEPKHEHKAAGIAYLASMWFSSADGQQIKDNA